MRFDQQFVDLVEASLAILRPHYPDFRIHRPVRNINFGAGRAYQIFVDYKYPNTWGQYVTASVDIIPEDDIPAVLQPRIELAIADCRELISQLPENGS